MKLTLSTRLVLGYSLVALATLLAVATYLSWRLRESFELEDTEFLADHVAMLRQVLLTPREDLHEVREVIVERAGVARLEKYYGRLVDDQGKVIFLTPGFQLLAPADSKFPEPTQLDLPLRKITRSQSPTGVPLFLGAALISPGPGRAPWRYQIIFDANHVEQWLAAFRLATALAVGVGTLVMSLLGWLTVSGGLRPVREITSAVQGVSATQLSARLGERGWPSEIAVLAKAFDGMSDRLQDSFDRLSQFSADIAHELRTPLSNLLGSTSLCLSKERSSEELRRALEGNLEEMERMTGMVNRLLFLARADNQEAKLHLEMTDCSEEVRNVAEFFSALAEEKGVRLVRQGHASVRLDVALFRQALSNLVSNALRHTPRGGQVTIHLQQKENGAMVAVRDTGEGIAEEHLPRIFDRFYRVDNDRAGAHPRAGIGLALVHSILQLHGGRVSLTSQPGQGSEFRMEFPGSEAVT